VLVVVGLTAAVWTAVLAQPGPAPLWLLVVLVAVLGTGGPASVVGIDIGRTSNPASSLGVAQAVINLGGFSASLVVLAAMGLVLDLAGGFTPGAFRLAWLVQYPVWAVGVVCVLLTRRTARREGPGPDSGAGPAGRPEVGDGALEVGPRPQPLQQGLQGRLQRAQLLVEHGELRDQRLHL
jgi:hypothetical protein